MGFFAYRRELRAARLRFEELVASGAEPEAAAEQVENEATARGLDIETIMAILALLMKLIEMFKKP